MKNYILLIASMLMFSLSNAQTIIVTGASNNNVNGTYTIVSHPSFEDLLGTDNNTNQYFKGNINVPEGYWIRRENNIWKINYYEILALVNARAVLPVVYERTTSDADANNPPCNATSWTNLSNASQEQLTITGSCYLPPSQASVINPDYISSPQRTSAELLANTTAPNGSIVFDVNALSLKTRKNNKWEDIGFTLPYVRSFGTFDGVMPIFSIRNETSQTAIQGFSNTYHGIHGETNSGRGGYFKANDSNGYALFTDGKVQLTRQGAGSNIVLRNYANTPTLTGLHSGGNTTTPTQTLMGNKILSIAGQGYTPQGVATADAAAIEMIANESFTSTQKGTMIQFKTTGHETNSLIERMRIDDVGNVGIGVNNPTSRLEVYRYGSDGRNGVLRITDNFNNMVFDGTHIDSDGKLFINNFKESDISLAGSGGKVFIGENGTGISEIIKVTKNIASYVVPANACTATASTVANAVANSTVYASPNAGLASGLIIAYARVTSPGVVGLRVCNITNSNITQPTIDYHITVIR